MSEDNNIAKDFSTRFRTREQVEHYRDRYTTGRRWRLHRKEESALKRLLVSMAPLEVALDIPCGTARLSPVLPARPAGRNQR